jgi:hypothetical protein
LILCDPDVISEENTATQGWPFGLVGSPKVGVLGSDCRTINPDVGILMIQTVFKPEMLNDATDVFVCTDSMSSRREVWEEILNFRSRSRHQHRTHIDGRMSHDVLRILCGIQRGQVFDGYVDTLYSDEEAVQEPCTRRGGCFTAAIAAGLMVNLFVRSVGLKTEVQPDTVMSLIAMSMFSHQAVQPVPKPNGTNELAPFSEHLAHQ